MFMFVTTSMILLSFPCFVAPKESNVYEFYTMDNFFDKIQEFDETFFMFYTKWSPVCRMLAPTWETLAGVINANNTNIAIAQVNCGEQAAICSKLHIKVYPMLMYYKKKSLTLYLYKGAVDLSSLIKFIKGFSDKIINKEL